MCPVTQIHLGHNRTTRPYSSLRPVCLLGDPRPQLVWPYLNYTMGDNVKAFEDEITKMLQALKHDSRNIINMSNSPSLSQIFIVPKPDRSLQQLFLEAQRHLQINCQPLEMSPGSNGGTVHTLHNWRRSSATTGTEGEPTPTYAHHKEAGTCLPGVSRVLSIFSLHPLCSHKEGSSRVFSVDPQKQKQWLNCSRQPLRHCLS